MMGLAKLVGLVALRARCMRNWRSGRRSCEVEMEMRRLADSPAAPLLLEWLLLEWNSGWWLSDWDSPDHAYLLLRGSVSIVMLRKMSG
jgi:hypothetical protein